MKYIPLTRTNGIWSDGPFVPAIVIPFLSVLALGDEIRLLTGRAKDGCLDVLNSVAGFSIRLARYFDPLPAAEMTCESAKISAGHSGFLPLPKKRAHI